MKHRPRQPDAERKWVKWPREVGIFVLGLLAGLFITQWFVELLPTPKIITTLEGHRGTTSNLKGCVWYIFDFRADEPIEYMHVKIQFPTAINNYQVGFPLEARTADGGEKGEQTWKTGKNAQGECVILETAVNNTADVQAVAIGNTIVIRTSKLPAKTFIVGAIAPSEQTTRINPAPKMFMEGWYEYTRLGQIVRKPLVISDKGIKSPHENKQPDSP